MSLLGEPYREADVAIDVAPAVGIALFPAQGTLSSALLQRAEVALFAALDAGEPVTVYDPGTDPHRRERLSLMGELAAALDRQVLQLHYQPKLALAESRFPFATSQAAEVIATLTMSSPGADWAKRS